MNYEEIFNLVYSNSTSISESILDIVEDNYLIEEEKAMKFADALHNQLALKGKLDPELVKGGNKAADKSFKVNKQVEKRYENS